ncbi:DUF3443 family protein [Thiomonas sp. FB-6]|uniref:DUF3443 family protein n=1 Tax=Thiomonas sp. FB-6 TaxID=1158291 RepID=UPI0003708DE5|nr:DUF3443 family protein [Thiomonas sp. FB-6]
MSRRGWGRALRAAGAALGVGLLGLLDGCGGGGGSSGTAPVVPAVGANQMLVSIEQNPALAGSVPTVNIPYVTVTVCDAGGRCVVVDHVVLDTGSYGLRVLESALGGLSLPPDTASGGTQLAECARFLSGYIWGGVSHASLQLGGQGTSALPIQVIGATTLPAAPSGCTNAGSDIGTLQALGGNGLLGVGQFVADGQPYYACGGGSCTELTTPPPDSAQVSNPVPYLNSSDTNGVVLQMPAIPTGGAGTTYGVLSLGVGTQADNAVTGYTALKADSGGNITVTVQGLSYPGSFLDSGSNFNFAWLNGVPADSSGNYTPASLLNLPITLSTSSLVTPPGSLNAQMYVGDYSSMDFAHDTAFNDLAAQVASSSSPVDLGLPFFYGRGVAYVIQGMNSPLGYGPMYALR